jgi:DNA-binding NarL/FixJ family response regulator
MFSNHPDLQVVGEAGSVEEAISKTLQLKPDLILMDMGLPDGTGVDALDLILPNCPEVKIVMLTVYDTDDMLFTALRHGAKGFLLKNTPLSNLLASIRALERGEPAISRAMTGRILDEFSRKGSSKDNTEPRLNILTYREREVLELLGEGFSNNEIAERLFITENTVKIHVHKILHKLKLMNRREAGEFARRSGITKLSPPTSQLNWH